ncbi:hypothetical protein B0H12DRAFT_1082737, partial [Mycena haematopus]
MSQAPTPDSNPAALLPPDLARQLQVATLVIVGTTAVLIWDILHHLKDDYHLVFRYRFRLSTAAYFLARIASLVYALGFTLLATYPIPDCQTAVIIFNCGHGLLVSSGATSPFLPPMASAVTVPIATKATRVGSLCLVTKISSYAGASATVLMVNDTSVILAISYRLLANTHRDRTIGDSIQT